MRPWVALLFAVSLLNSCETQAETRSSTPSNEKHYTATILPQRPAGSSAVTTVFVKKGDDLILDVDADVPERFLFVEWKLNKTVIVVRFAPGGECSVLPDFTGRVEFPVENFSVKLKNVQEADSGVYAAAASTFKGNQPLAEYKVTVQGPVSPVKLTVVSVVSRGSDSCNLTVTCSTQLSHISSTFRCVNRTCSQDGGERSELTTSGASLRLYLLNSEIICNHSNHVTWTTDFKNIENFCPQHAAPDPKPDPDPDSDPVLMIVITIVSLGTIVGLLVLIFYRRKKANYIGNTVF